LPVRFGGVRADFEKTAPSPPAENMAVVAHIAADAAERVAERAAAIRLQRMRRDRPQIAGGSRENVLDGGFGDLDWHGDVLALIMRHWPKTCTCERAEWGSGVENSQLG